VPDVTTTPDEAPQSAASRLFDLRILIGGLFVLYGIMLTVSGAFASAKSIAKASNINMNLWLGIGMLIVGLIFLAWWRLNPVRPEAPDHGGPPGGGGPPGSDRNRGAAAGR
jgi:hypothetical protein